MANDINPSRGKGNFYETGPKGIHEEVGNNEMHIRPLLKGKKKFTECASSSTKHQFLKEIEVLKRQRWTTQNHRKRKK